jgi:hypothetical protein
MSLAKSKEKKSYRGAKGLPNGMEETNWMGFDMGL